MTNNDVIKQLLIKLASSDRQDRQRAHHHLLEFGTEITPYLIEALKNEKASLRHSAAHVLTDLHDPEAAPALVETLLDESIEVHWAASEALIAMGRNAIVPVLQGLIRHFDSYRFRQGVFHVLHSLKRNGLLDPHSMGVFEALHDVEASIKAPWAAERALEALVIFKKPEAVSTDWKKYSGSSPRPYTQR